MCLGNVLRSGAGRTGMSVAVIISMIMPTPAWAEWSYDSEVVVSGSNGGSSGGWHSSYGSNGGSSGGSSGTADGAGGSTKFGACCCCCCRRCCNLCIRLRVCCMSMAV